MTEGGPPASAHSVAFMDIGTNSIRLLVVEINRNHSYRVLQQLKETVRLGEGEFGSQQLQPEAMDRAVAVVRQFATLARESYAEETIAVATAATREAHNQEAFLRRIKKEAGVDVHVVSGMEEARLIYLGVVSGAHLEDKQVLCIDIGGGSTEVIVGTQDQHLYLNSLKLGAIRLTNLLLGGLQGPVSPRLYEQVCRYVRSNDARTLRELREYQIDFAFGSSGTIENLAEMGARLFFKRPWQRDDTISAGQIRHLTSVLCSLPLEERRRFPGMNPARADIIIGGAAILDTLMEDLAISELRVSERGLREGLLVDYLRRNGHFSLVEAAGVRERSVLQLGRTCRFNEAHARTTARLALALFDSAKSAGIHRLGNEERELLEAAALLHHIGTFLTYTNYQKHSYYLIRNAELLGFDQTQIAIIAATTLYHRDSLPRKKDAAFAALTTEEQQAVRVLSTFLRLAENLDRSQTERVQGAHLDAPDARHAVLTIEAAQECHVELWGIENQMHNLEKALGRRLEVKVVQEQAA